MAEGKKPIKNGMHRLKALIFNDYRFKTQHQYKNYKNDTPFEMIEFREFFAVTLISIFSFFFVSKKWRSLFLWRSLRYDVSVILSFLDDKKNDCLFDSKQRVKNLILVERKVPSSFRYESWYVISKCRSSYHIEKKIGHIKTTVGTHFKTTVLPKINLK